MLTTLAILNSAKHAKAIIRLQDATAIQILGENKIGKTSLIDTLNFLYIINPNDMSFDSRSGNSTYSFKESVAHFFPHPNSYLIFECFKSRAQPAGYFCILVKRKDINDIEYYVIDKNFVESDFIADNGALKNFRDINKALSLKTKVTLLKNRTELLPYVYNKDTAKNAFVWLSDIDKKNRKSGYHGVNNLATAYSFLLNAGHITNDVLKDTLMIAGNFAQEDLTVFSDRTKIDEINNFNESKRHLAKLKSEKEHFEDLKLDISRCKSKKHFIGRLLYSCQTALTGEIETLRGEIKNLEKEITEQVAQKNDLDKKRDDLLKQDGLLSGQMDGEEKRRTQSQEILKEIQQIEDQYLFCANPEAVITLLEDKKSKKQEEYNSSMSSLQQIKQYNRTLKETEKEKNEIEEDISQLQNQINQYENLMIYNISDNENIRTYFNTIFSKEITTQFTKENIVKKIEFVTDLLNINEGQIKGFDKVKRVSLKSVDELSQKLKSTQKNLKYQLDILAAIQDWDGVNKKCSQLKKEMDKFDDEIGKLKRKNSIKQEISDIVTNITDLKERVAAIRKQDGEIFKKLKQIIEPSILEKNNHKIGKSSKIDTYETWWTELNRSNIEPIEQLIEKSVDTLYKMFRNEKEELNQLTVEKRAKLEALRRELNNDAAEPIFIEQIQQEMLSIHDKEKSIETLLDSISTRITLPVSHFLDKYKDFKVFVHKFNKEIAAYQISDLKALKIEMNLNTKLHADLEKIATIKRVDTLFSSKEDPEQKEVMLLLQTYMEKNRNISLKELFDISLETEEMSGTIKKIALKKGNESQGTIRMINLFLFLLIINTLKVYHEDNKLVFFIDEDVIDRSNMEQLVTFCRKNGFTIIFAAKHQIIGLEKYYFATKSAQHQHKMYVDEGCVEWAEKKSNS